MRRGGRDVLLLEKVEWGRLVDVMDVDGLLVAEDVLIRDDLVPDGIQYGLSYNPVTEEEALTILQQAGSAAFQALLAAAEASLDVVETKGPANAPPFPYIPRNAAVRLTFSELVDPATVGPVTIQIWSGDPPSQAVSVRYLVRNEPGRGKGVVILDPTISARQSSQLGLPQNSLGFPASLDSVADNLMLRFPTEVNTTFGQPEVLRNLARTRAIAPGPDDPLVNNQAGDPVIVRSLRTGNTSDPFRGFLRDAVRPNLIAVQDVTVDTIEQGASATVYELTYSVDAVNCRELAPKTGDVFEVGADVLLVTAVLSVGNPLALEVRATNLTEEMETPSVPDLPLGSSLGLSGRMTTRYTPQDSLVQACYLEFTPAGAVAPGQPITVDPFASVTVRFNEPMDPATVLSMHSLVVAAYEDGVPAGDPTAPYLEFGPESVADYIDRQRGYDNDPGDPAPEYGGRILFGPIEVGNGGRDYMLTPLAGWTDPGADGSQFYAVALRDGGSGVLDLSGNPLDFAGFVAGTPLPGVDVELTIAVDASGGTLRDKYFALRGFSSDENGDGLAEYAGQYDVVPGRITGRDPDRLSLIADGSSESIGRGFPLSGSQAPVEPLNPAGAVVMTVYRPHDLGLSYFNKLEYNLDAEGMAWAPLGGVVNDDTFARFRVELGHALQMPDEIPNPFNPTQPIYPNSGLLFGGTFDDNILGFPTFDERVVTDGEYTLRAVNLFLTPTGTTMLPFPAFTATYTWRDTDIPQSFTGAGPAGGSVGSPPSLVSGAGTWPAEEAPSVALPLLVHWSTFPRGDFIGFNQFQVSNLFPTGFVVGQLLPAFRILSSGGRDAGGSFNPVIPDNANFGGTRPTGGFQNGQPTPNHDQNVYWAQVDFVVRVSRVHTHWFAMGRPLARTGDAIGLIVEPDNLIQSPGTQVIAELRGSTSVQHPTDPDTQPSPLLDAERQFDDYGDFVVLSGNTSSVSTPGPWTSDLRQLEGQPQPYQFFQLRFTFVANADQGLQPYLDGFGLCWNFD